VGPNGAGKTNLLESLYVGTQGMSPRTRQDANLVRHGAAGFRVAVAGAEEGGELRLEVRVFRGEGKEARVNGSVAPSLEWLRNQVATLVFTPDRLAVVKASPAVRRSYVDRVLGRLYPARAAIPGAYAEALGQRNAALRRVAAGLASRDAITPWTERVAALGGELTSARASVVAALAPGFSERAGELGLASARLEYEPSEVSADVLDALLERDLARGLSGAGPQLDDVRFLAGAGDLRTHGSQGEQRVAVLAVLLAEAELLAARRAVPPLLLLDDVLSELDGDRRAALAGRLRSGGQTLVTAAARGALPGDPDLLLSVGLGRVTVD